MTLNQIKLSVFNGAVGKLTKDDAFYIKSVRFYNINPNEIKRSSTFSNPDGTVLSTKSWTDGYSYILPQPDEDKTQGVFIGWKHSKTAGQTLSAEYIDFDVKEDFKVDGFSVRITAPQGLRWITSLDRETSEKLSEIDGNIFFDSQKGKDASFGLIVIPNDYIVGEELSLETDFAAVSPANKLYSDKEGEPIVFANVLIDVDEADFKRSLTCCPYLNYTDMCGNTNTVYGQEYKSSLSGGLSLYSAAEYVVKKGNESEQTNTYLKENIMKVANKGTFINRDIDSHIRFSKYVGNTLTKDNAKEKLISFIDDNMTEGLTDMVFNIFSQCSATSSQFIKSFVDIYSEKVQNGIPVDWTSNVNAATAKVLDDYGLEALFCMDRQM